METPPPPSLPPHAAAYSAEPPIVAHIKLLSVFHYVMGGLMCLTSLFGLIYVAFGVFFLSAGPELASQPGTSGAPMPPDAEIPFQLVGGMFAVIGLGFTLLALTIGILIIMAGRKLARFEGRTFCIVMACLQCLSFPLGTALGVFTLIILNKPEALWLFTNSGQPGAERPGH